MDNLIKRLSQLGCTSLEYDAADAIERLTARVAKLEREDSKLQLQIKELERVVEISFDDKDEAFDNKFYKLKLFNYKDTAVFSISNNLILNEFKLFTLDKINLKLEEIEKEIKELKTF